jgi:hypothetical protein
MSKTSGLGDRFIVGGYDISGDINALDKISATVATLDVTDITQLAHARLTGHRDGAINVTSYMSITGTGPFVQDPPLPSLPTTDTIASYCRGTTVGNAAASISAKQVDYNPTRDNKGGLTFKTQCVGNAYGLEWGIELTPGVFTSTNSLVGTASTFETNIANWAAITNCSVAQSNTQAHGGTQSLRMSSTASGDMVSGHCAAASVVTQGFAVVPGQQVLVSAWERTSVSTRTVSTGVAWYTSGGVLVGSIAYGTGATDSASVWTQISSTLVAPATAAFGIAVVKVTATAAGSELHYVDDVQFIIMPGVIDNGASTAFGAQAYYQLTAFTGTDITVKVQHSSDNVTWTDLIAFTQSTTSHAFERKVVSNVTTVNRYVQVIAVTTAGFTVAQFNVVFIRNPIAGVVF